MQQIVAERIAQWLSGPYDQDTKDQIIALEQEGKLTELNDSFYKNLEFGTGGLRGLMGPGTNRINRYTIGMATQGLANYIKIRFENQANLSVAIAYDSRHNSHLYASIAADVFSANGIKVYIFQGLRPTPMLSFAIRHYQCQSGIVITASHNPKEYNGYKAYWNDGAQVVFPDDANIIAEVEKISSPDQVQFVGNHDLIEVLSEQADQAYLDMAAGLSVSPELVARQKDLKIVYSPLHGSGITLLPKLLDKIGFENVQVVAEQSVPDGNFPTLLYPNPEEKEAMAMALEQAKASGADLVLATDPDADRVGIAAKNQAGDWQLFNGNQTATVLFYYMLEAWKNAGKLNGKQYVVKTIVTTDILDQMAASYGVECFNTLTGFKYIAQVIRNLEGQKEFILGGEESYGYLIGDKVRDKDAVSSAALIAETLAYAKDKGLGVVDLLIEAYQKFGFYKEALVSVTKKGQQGSLEIEAIMAQLRSNPPATINGEKTTKLIDYQLGFQTDLLTGKSEKIDFETSNVLQFITEKNTKISARPSGTEPKIKFYFSVNAPLINANDYAKTEALLDEKIKNIIIELKLY